MERLKDPTMLLTIANTIGIVGSTAYFYKQMEAMRLDMIKISQTLTACARKIGELEKADQHKGESLRTLNDEVKRINQQIESIPSFETIDGLDADLDEIVSVLDASDITVDRPSQIPRQRIGKRRTEDNDDRRDNSRRPARSTNVREDKNRTETNRDQNRRAPRRESNRETRNTQPRHDSRTEPSANVDDDADLIGEIRSKQVNN